MKQKLTNEEVAKVLTIYWGNPCQRIVSSSGLPSGDDDVINMNVDVFKQVTSGTITTWTYKLLLTPLSKISDEEVLELCKLYSPEIYGDYRYKKWYIEQDGTKSDTCNTVDVKRQSDTYYFQLDKIDGEMRLYDEEMIDSASVNHYYHQWYFMNGFAIPLFFGIDHWANGKTAIQLGIALDKTTIE